jgi:Recombination endonuclease VII
MDTVAEKEIRRGTRTGRPLSGSSRWTEWRRRTSRSKPTRYAVWATQHRRGFPFSLKKYGLTVEDYARLMHAQGLRCALCPRPLAELGADVDHDHVTGRVRGLLCPPCNTSLGSHTAESLRRFLAYVEGARLSEHCVTSAPPARTGTTERIQL